MVFLFHLLLKTPPSEVYLLYVTCVGIALDFQFAVNVINGSGPPAGRSPCPMRTRSYSMCLYLRWIRSVRMQNESKSVKPSGPALFWCSAAWSVPALSGRFLPQLLAVICMHSGRRFVLQRRIWPKYNFKGDAPPSVSSASRIFAEREAFIFVCLLCDARLTAFFCTFWRILVFLWSVLQSDVCSCLYRHQTGVWTEVLSSRTVAEKRLGRKWQLYFSRHPPVSHSDARNDCMLQLKTHHLSRLTIYLYANDDELNENGRLWCWNKLIWAHWYTTFKDLFEE